MQTNQTANKPREVEIGEMRIEIRAQKKTLSGQLIAFKVQGSVEIDHRIRCAWSASARHRQELTCKSKRLEHMMRLFQSVVSPSILHGSETWAVAREHEKQILTEHFFYKADKKILKKGEGKTREWSTMRSATAIAARTRTAARQSKQTVRAKRNRRRKKRRADQKKHYRGVRKKWVALLEAHTGARWAKRVAEWNPSMIPSMKAHRRQDARQEDGKMTQSTTSRTRETKQPEVTPLKSTTLCSKLRKTWENGRI